jgi:hypothetical protein
MASIYFMSGEKLFQITMLLDTRIMQQWYVGLPCQRMGRTAYILEKVAVKATGWSRVSQTHFPSKLKTVPLLHNATNHSSQCICK